MAFCREKNQKLLFKVDSEVKFRKWFKYGLKAQKLQKQHALKGQKLLAQGSALGTMAISKAPCKGKSFKTPGNSQKLLPLKGALLTAFIPRALPWAKSFCPFRACCL